MSDQCFDCILYRQFTLPELTISYGTSVKSWSELGFLTDWVMKEIVLLLLWGQVLVATIIDEHPTTCWGPPIMEYLVPKFEAGDVSGIVIWHCEWPIQNIPVWTNHNKYLFISCFHLFSTSCIKGVRTDISAAGELYHLLTHPHAPKGHIFTLRHQSQNLLVPPPWINPKLWDLFGLLFLSTLHNLRHLFK